MFTQEWTNVKNIQITIVYSYLWMAVYLISSELWPNGYNGGLVIWIPCGVGVSNPTVDTIFCNVYLFRVPRSWSDSVQMKSSITFIRGNRCLEREKDNFKSRYVKRLKECASSFQGLHKLRMHDKYENYISYLYSSKVITHFKELLVKKNHTEKIDTTKTFCPGT